MEVGDHDKYTLMTRFQTKFVKCRQIAVKVSNNKFHENYFRGSEMVIHIG